MPELPEVETIVRDLQPVLPGQVFESISAEHLPSISPSLEAFDKLVGCKVERVWRRGKFIVIDFEKESCGEEELEKERQLVVTIHLRMSGRLLMRGIDDEPLKHERTRLDFSKGSLRFVDMRKFGKVWLSTKDSFEKDTGIWRLGVEPFSTEFDKNFLIDALSGKKGAVKKWLLDQSVIAGVGNIYADEACFYAKIRPDRDVASLSKKQLERLWECVLIALNQGIRNRGTSISDYQDAFGKMGTNQELLYVYGRGGRDCIECGKELVKIKCAGRGTVYCGECQE